MITDRQLVDLAAAIYDPASSWHAGPFTIDGNYFAVAKVADDYIAVPRGSITFQDWVRDGISFMPTTISGFEAIGAVPEGFAIGLVPMFHKILDIAGDAPTIYFTGHSLGAAHAGDLALMAASAGLIPRGALFAPPRFCMRSSIQMLVGESPQLRGYRNRRDPVPHEPPSTELLPWGDLPGPDLDEAPDHPVIRPLARHSIKLYQRGVYKLFPEAVAA